MSNPTTTHGPDPTSSSSVTDDQPPPPASPATLVALAWLAMIGVDFLLHGGLLARLYVEPSPFLLPPAEAFARIPLGYLSFGLMAVLLVWFLRLADVRGGRRGGTLGLALGALVWGSYALGLASISTAPTVLLVGWLAGQSIEVAIAGAVVGAGLAGARTRTLALRTLVLVLVAVAATVVLQSAGLAPATKLE